MDFFDILKLIGGLSLFLYGMDIMGKSLKKIAGGRLESILERLTSNRIKGFLLGLFVTGTIQSSSATIVMLVGFVNSGIMKLEQTISIIMGANIGTTVTAWLLSLQGINGESFFVRLLNPSSFTPILAGVGIVMNMACKSDKKKDIGSILLGFAILMFGMDTMSGAAAGLKNDEGFKHMLIMFSDPLMGIIIGTAVTAVIQSSSASVGILQALSMTVAVKYETAIPIILGMNIGATVTPMISALAGNQESKRVGFACLYIKMLGVIVVAPLFYLLNRIIGFSFMQKNVDVVTIAIIHSLFNILSTIILMPFCRWIEILSQKTIKGSKKDEIDILNTLDDRFLSSPSFAIQKCHMLVSKMAETAVSSITQATSLLSSYDDKVKNKITLDEETVDRYEDKLGTYLVKLSSVASSTEESSKVSELLHVIGDVERLSDHAVNIASTATEIYEKHIKFSEDAKADIDVISAAVQNILELAVGALENEDLEMARKVEPLEQVIDHLKHVIKNNHIKRLQDGNCTVEFGFILSDLLINYERIADHCSNIAVCLLEISKGSFETHRYLEHLKKDGDSMFDDLYQYYKTKYVI